jgi:Domain of unknown function (DUF4376)
MSKYASTRMIDGVETVGVVLPLDMVPMWNPDEPLPHTYLVNDQVEVGWLKKIDDTFSAPPPPSADKIWSQIKAERDRRTEIGGYSVMVGGVKKWFHSDTKSRAQQIALVLMGQSIPAGIDWKTMDGSFVEMTPAIAQSIFQSAATQDQATFLAAEKHKQLMQSSTKPWEYDYSTGWPAVYMAS